MSPRLQVRQQLIKQGEFPAVPEYVIPLLERLRLRTNEQIGVVAALPELGEQGLQTANIGRTKR